MKSIKENVSPQSDFSLKNQQFTDFLLPADTPLFKDLLNEDFNSQQNINSLSKQSSKHELSICIFPTISQDQKYEKIAPSIDKTSFSENSRATRENKKLISEITSLKQQNQKLNEELNFKSKQLINKTKDLQKTNEKLIELEQELAFYKLESISMVSPTKIFDPGQISSKNEAAIINVNDIKKASKTISSPQKIPEKSPTKEIHNEVKNLKDRKNSLSNAIEDMKTKLNNLQQEKIKLEKEETDYNQNKISELESSPLAIKKEKISEILIITENMRKRANLLNSEVQNLKSIIQAKNEHLAILRKQMAERAAESILSDTEGFFVTEEKASHEDLKEQENLLRIKEAEYKTLITEIQKTSNLIEQSQKNVSRADAAAGMIISQTLPDSDFKSFRTYTNDRKSLGCRNRSSDLGRRATSPNENKKVIGKRFELEKIKLEQDILYFFYNCDLIKENCNK